MAINSSIINIHQLSQELDNPNLRLFDVRTGANAYQSYQDMHLKNAVFVDLNTNLAEIDDYKFGGRHPLPKFDDFINIIGDIGIAAESIVVIYDDKNGANASARFWWMLKALGHQNVFVLDGGFQIAEKFGFPMESGISKYPQSKYHTELSNWVLPIVEMKAVEIASKNSDFVIVDVRESSRFDGITEPIDLVAGHIPNAINIPFTANLDENGLFKSKEELKSLYSQLFKKFPAEKIIFHCGSGVTACHSLLAINNAGFDIPNLYVGSWSEWSRNHDL